jgi:cell division protein FtsB
VSVAQGNKGGKGTMFRIGEAIYRVRRRVATGLAVVLAVFFAYHVVFGRNGINTYEEKRAEDKALKQQINSLQHENGQLKDHVGRLKNDPDAIEFEAREKLHYARPGEVVYTLNQPQSTSNTVATPSGSQSEGSN